MDLSKNMLTELPENFGEMTQLRHLDLYANQVNNFLRLCYCLRLQIILNDQNKNLFYEIFYRLVDYL